MNDTAFPAVCAAVLTSVVVTAIHRRKLNKIELITSQQMIEEHTRGFRRGYTEGYRDGKRRGHLDVDPT